MSDNHIAEKIEKLLRMAEGHANEHESALALQMAQRLADAHNLDIGVIGKSGARQDEQIQKGMYQYQRNLWELVAKLNHCYCWVFANVGRGKPSIRILGSKLNVTTTRNLCGYIEEVTNRLVRERFPWKQFLSRDAHYFREGVIDRLISRIREKREEEERIREQRKREEEAKHPGSATAIVLIKDVSLAEERANYDYLYGAGSWDRRQAKQRQWEQERRDAEEAYKKWAQEHPEEVKQQEEERRKALEDLEKKWARNARAREKAREKRESEGRYTYRRRQPSKYDSEHYYAGQEEANKVSLNDQIDKRQRKSSGDLPGGGGAEG